MVFYVHLGSFDSDLAVFFLFDFYGIAAANLEEYFPLTRYWDTWMRSRFMEMLSIGEAEGTIGSRAR